MKLRNKVLSVVAASALAVGLTFAARPQAAFGPEGRLKMLASHLDLTDAQKQAAQSIFQQARTDAQPVVQQLKQNHEAIAAAVKAGRSDAEITQVASAQGPLVGQLAAIHAKAMAHFYAQLTPEQKAKADELHSHMQGMFQQHLGMHHELGQ